MSPCLLDLYHVLWARLLNDQKPKTHYTHACFMALLALTRTLPELTGKELWIGIAPQSLETQPATIIYLHSLEIWSLPKSWGPASCANHLTFKHQVAVGQLGSCWKKNSFFFLKKLVGF